MKQDAQSKKQNSHGNTSKQAATIYRYSRTSKASIQSQCSDVEHITILEGPYSYWIYDEDAEKVSSVFGFELYKTKKGFTLVYEKPLHKDFIEELRIQGFNIVIVHPDTLSEILTTREIIPKGKPIEENTVFVLENSSGHIKKYVIKEKAESERLVVNCVNDTTVIGSKPVFRDSSNPDVHVISRKARIAALLIGKHVGDTVSSDDETYKIIEIGSLDHKPI